MRRGWSEAETAEGLLHSRAGLPVRWDLAVTRSWPVEHPVSRRRYARQVRQDLWRAAQAVRGFVPKVLVARTADSVRITGGGVLLAGRAAPGLAEQMAGVMDDQGNRARWDRFARVGGS